MAMDMKQLEEKVKDIIVEELGVERDKLTSDASFMEDLGADSLDTVELVMAFEKEFDIDIPDRSEEHTSELQSRLHLVCRLLLEKKKTLHIRQPRSESPVSRDPPRTAR